MTNNKIEIFVENQRNTYGDWIKLPIEESNLISRLNQISPNKEEVLIVDYDAPFKISETADILQLNRILPSIEDMKLFSALVSVVTDGDLELALKMIKEETITYVADVENLEEAAELLIENGYLGEFPTIPKETEEFIIINYEAIANHLETGLGWKHDAVTKIAVCTNYKK